MPDYSTGNTSRMMEEFGLTPPTMCLEISERFEMKSLDRAQHILKKYKSESFRIALDDYGSGFSGLQLLYLSEPDFIKIDRFFIDNIAGDPRKKLFVANVVDIAHLLGITVIGEGIETEAEFAACRDVGCDMVQGYFIGYPTTDPATLPIACDIVTRLGRRERRERADDHGRLKALACFPSTVHRADPMEQVLEVLKADSTQDLLVVLNELQEPLGIIRQADVRTYLYSPYGWALLTGTGTRVTAEEFVRSCPVVDVSLPVEHVMGRYSVAEGSSEGVLLVDGGTYAGFLSVSELLKAVNERNLDSARDQNPLTHLPGNRLISDFVSDCAASTHTAYSLVHFDFDHFKPFNDRHGFRRGDRAIRLFADILRAASIVDGFFVAHLGGDDFFAGMEVGTRSFEACEAIASAIAEKFRSDVVALYDPEERRNGVLLAEDRSGLPARFPLLTVSTSVLRLPVGRTEMSTDEISSFLATLKAHAKADRGSLVTGSVLTTHRRRDEHPQSPDGSLRVHGQLMS
jgi:diguanylate cyclase (GGDEF)-like protein